MTRVFGLGVLAGLIMLTAGAALAEAPDRSVRPEPRPMAVVADAAGLPLMRPRTRPAPAANPALVAALAGAPRVAAPAPVPQTAAVAVAVPPAEPVAVQATAAGPDTPRPQGRASMVTVSTSGVRLPEPLVVMEHGVAVLLPVAVAAADTPRPRPRAAGLLPVVPVALTAAEAPLRPRPRPVSAAMPAPEPAAMVAAVPVSPALAGLARSLRPEPRPKGLAKRRAVEEDAVIVQAAAAAPAKPGKTLILPKKGSLCGDRAIRGEALAPITAKVKGCGIAEPVKVTQVAGVKLSQPALMDCPTAVALRKWVDNGLQPNFGRNPVVELKVAGHYVCRTRNHKKGAKISEHGKGRAIDISGFTLSNGKTVSILKGWRGDYGKAIRAAHKAACGTFGTTLGPGSDGYHEDHLHFDTARYRKGAYCR